MTCSIRQLADRLHVSHTTVCNAMKTLAESHGSIGTQQGRGKPTLLSDADQQLITDFLQAQPDSQSPVHDCSTSTTTQDDVVQGEIVSVDVSQPQSYDLELYQSQSLNLVSSGNGDNTALTTALAQLTTVLQNGQGNTDLVSQALIRQAGEEGTQLGVRMVAAKINNATKVKEQGDLLLLQQLGLLSDHEAQAS